MNRTQLAGIVIVILVAIALYFFFKRDEEPEPPVPPPPPPPPPPGLGNLYGIVSDESTGKAIAGVKVSIGGKTAYTNGSGAYVIQDLSLGAYTLSLEMEGYKPYSHAVTIIEGNNELNITMLPIAGPPEPGFYWLRPTGHIVGNWNNAILAYDGLTDTRAEVVGVSPQSWSSFLELTIELTEISAVRWWGSSPVSPKKIQVDVRYGGAYHNIYEGDAVILWNDGLVIAEGTKTISGARIRFYNPSRSVTMKFRVNELQFYGYAEQPPIPPGPPPTTKLSGYVTDIITGMPIVGVTGTVYQDYGTKTKSYSFTTNSVGYYEIRDMLHEYDSTQMVIYATGYETHTDENVTIVEGENKLDVRMKAESGEA